MPAINHQMPIDGVLDALADPTRRSIVELLVRKPHRATELARAAGISRSRASKHLRVLLDAGVARDERLADDARVRVFHLRPESMDRVRTWLDALQTDWDRQLQSFKRHVSRRSSR